MQLVPRTVKSHVGVKDVFLLGHRRDGAFGNNLDHVWYSSTPTTGATLLADIEALFAVGDDLLSTQQDRASVVTVGANVRIQRLDIATLVVVAQPPHTCYMCQDVISACAHVLSQCKFTNTCNLPFDPSSPIPLHVLQMFTRFCLTHRWLRHLRNSPVFVLLSDLEGSRDIPC